jgi:hypothetical protein
MPLKIGEESSISTPESGLGALAPKTDGNLYYKNDGGTEYQLTGQAESVTGARNDSEAALANLLTALENLGIIVDNTTAS